MFILQVAAPVSPAVFGQVFRAHRGALVQVRTASTTARFTTGFVIGARGEVLYGATKAPNGPVLELIGPQGQTWFADLLGYDRTLKIALAKVRGAPRGLFVPMQLAGRIDLRADLWVVVLGHDESGVAEPFAGVVERVSSKGGLRSMRLMASGQAGNPVMSTEGELVGVVYEGGRRRVSAWAIDGIVPFLKRVVVASGAAD